MKTFAELKKQLDALNYANLTDVADLNQAIRGKKTLNAKMAIHDANERVLEVSSMPMFYDIEITNHCNLRCIFCPTGQRDANVQRGFMDADFYKYLIDQISDHAIAISLVNWGEPLLHKDCIKLIRYAKEKNIFVRISTNASISLNKGYWKEFLSSGIDCLHLDLDGMTQDSYAKYRRGEISKQ